MSVKTNSTSSVLVKASATVANLAVGYDILGLALSSPSDLVRATLSRKSEVVVKAIKQHSDLSVPLVGNTAEIAVRSMLGHLRYSEGVILELEKGMPIGSGLGSSAASAAAAVVAVNELLGLPLQRKDLVQFVQESEKAVSGFGHADNAAPALLGGIVLIVSYQPLILHSLNVPDGLAVSVVHPHCVLSTESSRKALRKELLLTEHVSQSSALAASILGFERSDISLLRASMKDTLIEPQRAVLIPGFYQVKEAALQSGAISAGISGSGPSVFALCENLEDAEVIGARMQAVFTKIGLKSDRYSGLVNKQGAERLE